MGGTTCQQPPLTPISRQNGEVVSVESCIIDLGGALFFKQ